MGRNLTAVQGKPPQTLLVWEEASPISVRGKLADGGPLSPAGETASNRPATLADYLAILRRRKWQIIAMPIIAATVAYVVSARQSPQYKANAEVYVNLSNLAAAFAGVNPSGGDPTRLLTNQAVLARSEQLASRVVDAAGVPGMTPGAFLGQSSAAPRSDADFVELSVTSERSPAAVSLVNAYAREFTRYKNEVDTRNVEEALRSTQATIDSLRAHGQVGTPAYDDAVAERGQLQTFGKLLANNASVQQLAEGAGKIRPLPRRNAILGGLLGLVLGIGLAFLAEALDKRVRTEQEIEAALGLPLLGRLPSPGRRLRKRNRLVMLAEPRGVQAETYRKLRTSLEFVNYERNARTIMMTSAGPREGKSTTVANLAVALARAGRQVALVDLDLRRPFLHSFFGVGGDYGITDVVVDRVDLDQALRAVALPAGGGLTSIDRTNGQPPNERPWSNGRSDAEGILHLLPCGTIPPAADEFLERKQVGAVLQTLSREFDFVLVDAPPLLAVGDALALSTKVDAVLVVTRLGIHRRQLQELARQLQSCRAEILGFILTGVSHGDSYAYGYGYDPHVYDAQRGQERRGERV
jgi:succinoglycan biosynthesis transport protein ExoP